MKKFLLSLLGLVSFVSIHAQNDYNLYTGDLTGGDYLITYAGKALKAEIASNRFAYAEITATDDVVEAPDEALIWTITINDDGGITLYNAKTQKYAASTGAKNQGALVDEASEKAIWNCRGSETYDFTNVFNKGANVNANLRGNGTYGFATYAEGTGGPLTLYKKSESVDPDKVPAALGKWTFDKTDDLLAGTGVAAIQAATQTKGAVTIAESPAAANITVVEGPTANNGAISVPVSSSLKMAAGIDAESVSTYTFMFDIMANDLSGYSALLQNDLTNTKDGSFFINGGKIGLNASGLGYNGALTAGKWHRVVFVSDEAVATVYLDGVQVGKSTSACEEHWKLSSGVLFFADNDAEEKLINVAELRFWDKALTEGQVAKLGAVKQDPVFTNFAAANAEATTTSVSAKIKFEEALITYVNGKNIFLQDATGALYLYNVSGDITVKAGDKVKGSVVGSLLVYNGLPEVSAPTLSLEVLSSDNAVNPIAVSAADLAANPTKFANQYIVLKGAKFAAAEFTSKNVTINVNGKEFIVRNNYGIDATFDTDNVYDVAGIVSIFKDDIQLYPTKAEDIAKNDILTSYTNALAAIKDGQTYRVFTEIEGKKYYLSPAGRLVDNTEKAGTYLFQKAQGGEYEYGFKLNSNGLYFSNPPGTAEANLKSGYITTSTRGDNAWEAQVFFLKDGKYAVRGTNAAYATSGWAWVASSYWTVEKPEGEENYVAQYDWNPAYVWQIEENVDSRMIFANVGNWAYMLQSTEGLVTTAAQLISNAADPGEGKYYDYLLDGDYSTYWHSSWRSDGPDEDHYLQAELTEATKDFYIFFKKRHNNNNNRPTKFLISGSNDGTTFSEITTITEGLPTNEANIFFASDKITASEAYKYLRFQALETNNGAKANGHLFVTYSEFYILPSDELTDLALPAIKQLAAASSYTDLTAQQGDDILAMDKKIMGQYAGVYTLASKLLAEINATDTYEASEDFVTRILGELGTIANTYYTSQAELDEAKKRVIALGQEFVKGVKAKTAVDATWFIGNPTPTRNNYEPWTPDRTGGFATGNSCTEFWNQSAANIKQALTLPAGEYKLSATAVTRTGMAATLSADDLSMTIATIGNDVVNTLWEADKWFVAGNGKNELEFTMPKDGQVTIQLTADAANGDHWIIFKDFSLTKMPDVDTYELALAAIEDGANYSISANVGGKKFYLTADGNITEDHANAGTFSFKKVTKDGTAYGFGFLVDDGGTRFSNPAGTNESNLKSGKINTSTNTRADWDAQVFFMANGKFAVRCTNAPAAASGWGWVGSSYWTIEKPEGAEDFVAQYAWEPEYIWQLEKNKSIEITYNLVEAGETTATEKANAFVGFVPKAPASFNDKFNGLFKFNPDVEIISEGTTAVNLTPVWNGPFEFTTNAADPIWFNMTIRGDWQVSKCATEPYTMKQNATEAELSSPEFQWAFLPVEGNPVKVVLINKAAEGQSLTPADGNAVLRDGNYAWDVFANGDGFVLREVGTDNKWVNQSGGGKIEAPLAFWDSANGKTDNGSTFRVKYVPVDVILNAPTWSVAEGTQTTPTIIPEGQSLKINYTALNLEKNELTANDVKVKVTVMVAGDLPGASTMGSETAHAVRGEVFYIPLGETEFPVALKPGYVYQNIAVMAADLVIPAKEATEGSEATEEKVIASYTGAPAMLHWVSPEVTPEAAYEIALLNIEDGANYSISTEVNNEKYYLTADGKLTADLSSAGTFTFKKIEGAQYKYGFNLLDSYFTNPPQGGNPTLNNGKINTDPGSHRADWEAQVFFLKDGKYAVRSTNAAGGESGWALNATAFWAVNSGEEGPVAEYSFDMNYIWQLEKNTLVEIACNLVEDGEVTATVTQKVPVGFVPTAPAEFIDKFHGLYTLTSDVAVITAETTAVNFTPAWGGLFQFSESFEKAKWYNMTIRSTWQVSMCDAEPYTMKENATEDELLSEEFQWAFAPVAGEPFQVVIYNKAAGAGQSLSVDGSNVVMRDGETKWEIFGNSDGFVMRPVGGGENDWVNQSGGGKVEAPLSFWQSENGKTDNGSTFRVSEVQLPEIVLNAPAFIVDKKAVDEGTQADPNMLPAGSKLQIKCTGKNYADYGYVAKDLKVKITVMMMGDLPENLSNMASTTAHRVLGETFDVAVGTTDFPVEMKAGYVYQNIAVMSAVLMTKDTEEPLATYAEPIQLHWVGLTDANGIKDIKALEGAEIYDLGGSKTQKIQKGKAYIIDGKTVIAK